MRPLSRILRRAALSATLLAALTSTPALAAGLKPPVLQEPAKDAVIEQAESFAWKPVKNAASYEYQISADAKFGSMVLGAGFGRGTAKTTNTAASLAETLPDGRYYWRVRTIDTRARAGKWSRTQTFTKDWAAQPDLLSPTEDFGVTWPSAPLVLRWSEVPYAFDYSVTIATDPALASPVLGGTAKPVRTRGTVFALPNTLPPGRYYWAIRPFDTGGHSGHVSRIGSFTWSWPTATATRVTDLNDAPEVFDPQFSWDAIPGAAYYEVEANASQDFASGSRVCCTDLVTGTSLSPTRTFENNTYYWRVRAIDDSGVSGQWNVGPSFVKTFDNKSPSVPNLRMRAPEGELTLAPDEVPAMPTPIITWDPVPGASSYEVQVAPVTDLGCDWGSLLFDDFTAATSWTPLQSRPLNSSGPGPDAWGTPRSDNSHNLIAGAEHCARVLARSDRPASDDNGFISTWTYVSGDGFTPAFKFTPPVDVGTPTVPFVTPPGAYLEPISGTGYGRLPLFTWDPVPGAKGYYVVVSNDPDFTTVTDYAYTRITAYAPGTGPNSVTYPDETTQYYWTVLPAANANGTGVSAQVDDGVTTITPFDKRSTPPTLLGPPPASFVELSPTFRWTPTEGARRYRLQVATDPTFANPIDNVVTASTAYTSSTAYPADADLYWRVQMLDENGLGMSWSTTGTFRRRLPVPVPAADMPAAGSGIPVLSFSPITGAVSYDIHVEQSDGKAKDFTVRSPVFAPIAFYGSGVFNWRARANFATGGGKKVSGGYFPPLNFVRSIPAPGRVVGTKTSSRVFLAWDPVPAAEKYGVDLSLTNDYSAASSHRTATTAFAPDLTSSVAKAGGRVYWRVQAIDEGNARGVASTGTFVLPKGIEVKIDGRPRRGKRSTVVLKLVDTRGLAVSKAEVRVTGAGLKRAMRRSDKRGRVSFRGLRATRRGELVFTVSKRGFRTGRATVRVR